ncbi:NAD(P)H-dependent flavin oxidoreductase [Raoultella terrigena]|uniref:NAD(P)H-dependent flavin oxidoreductase n=1 Tax=Raoultella terrigena TaxID=577 RepID=UPI002DBE81DB|nr:nitronate monooxygenase [Raoultella terrigena]MEB7599511.1 nitronate monooxygenase [Raoultella terrigena]
MSNRLLQQLDIVYPIIQAPMAGVSTPELAAAVSNAGGLGSLGLGASSVSQARALIDKTRRLTDRAFNVNLFCHLPAPRDEQVEARWLERLRPAFAHAGSQPPAALTEIYQTFLGHEAMLELLLELAPPVVSFHFGIPSREVILRLQERGIVTMATATSVEEARQIEAQGVDIVIAQGYEAGGHRGIFDERGDDQQLSTFTLVQSLKRAVSLPIIAAGGIMDGAGICRAMSLGAEGAQLGTAFLLCPESAADSGYRQAIKADPDPQTLLTAAISGRPARCIHNGWRALAHQVAVSEIPAYPLAYAAGKALATAAKAGGDERYGAHWAGQRVGLIRELSATELMETLIHECGLRQRREKEQER